jgi:uncharacterized membrane-anchored protein YhcB (DUF1043 family)
MNGTGLVESWTANPSQLGPIYPLIGWETASLVLVIGLWLGWTVWQIRTERAEHQAITQAVQDAEKRRRSS